MAERSINAALVAEARALDARGNFADLGVPDYRRMIRRLADALEALEREAGEGWREVESAPKDGTAFLGWGEVRPTDEDDQVTPRGARRAVVYWDSIDEAWAVSSHPWNGPFFAPTLWRPLPPPPTMRAAVVKAPAERIWRNEG